MTPSWANLGLLAGGLAAVGLGWSRIRRSYGRRTGSSRLTETLLVGVGAGLLSWGCDRVSRGNVNEALPLGSWHWATPPHVMPLVFVAAALDLLWRPGGVLRPVWRGGGGAARLLVAAGHVAFGLMLMAEWSGRPPWTLVAALAGVAALWVGVGLTRRRTTAG